MVRLVILCFCASWQFLLAAPITDEKTIIFINNRPFNIAKSEVAKFKQMRTQSLLRQIEKSRSSRSEPDLRPVYPGPDRVKKAYENKEKISDSNDGKPELDGKEYVPRSNIASNPKKDSTLEIDPSPSDKSIKDNIPVKVGNTPNKLTPFFHRRAGQFPQFVDDSSNLSFNRKTNPLMPVPDFSNPLIPVPDYSKPFPNKEESYRFVLDDSKAHLIENVDSTEVEKMTQRRRDWKNENAELSNSIQMDKKEKSEDIIYYEETRESIPKMIWGEIQSFGLFFRQGSSHLWNSLRGFMSSFI